MGLMLVTLGRPRPDLLLGEGPRERPQLLLLVGEGERDAPATPVSTVAMMLLLRVVAGIRYDGLRR